LEEPWRVAPAAAPSSLEEPWRVAPAAAPSSPGTGAHRPAPGGGGLVPWQDLRTSGPPARVAQPAGSGRPAASGTAWTGPSPAAGGVRARGGLLRRIGPELADAGPSRPAAPGGRPGVAGD